MKNLLMVIFVSSLLTPALLLSQSDVLLASLHDDQNLVTRINCHVEEEQHFRYVSESSLWESMGGKIFTDADILFRCLGDDSDGKYGSAALKYNVEISNLKISEGTQRKRKKRSARDFFSNSWKKVKKLFNRLLGRCQNAETNRASSSGDDVITDDVITDDVITDDESDEVSAAELYTVPFQLIQLANGSIPEIRFSETEVEDGRVKNFKRHLADAFATRLLLHHPQGEVENSVVGKHTSTYNISISGNKKSDYNVAGLPSTSLPPETDKNVIVVNKVVTTDDIVHFAHSEALNDKERMDLRFEQSQMFQDGRMTVSRGTSTLSMVTSNGVKKRRRRRMTDDDVTSYIRTQTSFDLQLRRRRRRSVEDSIRREEKHSFKAASRIAEVETDLWRKKKQLSDLQESVDLNSILNDLLISGREMDDNKIQSLIELLKQEITLNLDKEVSSLCNAVRRTFTLQVMEEMCDDNFSVCKNYLHLLAFAGSSPAEEIFLHFLGKNSSLETIHQQQIVADILSDISRPSPQLLMKLSEIVFSGKSEVSALSISLGHLASSAEPGVKNRVSDLFSDMLQDKECDGDPNLMDLLEAVGNLKCDRIIQRVLEVSRRCRESSAVQIASIHALRHSAITKEVEGWMESLSMAGDCDVLKEVLGSLVDKIQDQEMAPDMLLWPRFHFNRVDEVLRDMLQAGYCSPEEDILLYFSRKENVIAKKIVVDHSKNRRRKRAIWDDLNCQEWTEDNRYNPIQKKEEFASDRSTYNKRKSCLAFRKLGVKGANAEIYAGMFAGLREPSDPPKYKLFTKFVSGFNFLGQQIEVGSFYFYLYSGKTKAYVRIMGRTRQEFTNDGCTPTELRYRPLKHIPLYLVNIGNIQMSLGIHLSSRLSVDTLCPQTDIYQLQPLTNVRIGGEALGTVGFIRGAANLGANFNYKLQFTFTPTPNMCLKGSHGFDPMSINFESYFQLWNSVKEDWGKTRVWKPSFVSWELKRGELKQWFDDTCIALQSAQPNIEREME